MRIIGKLSMGTCGTAQILRTEDSAVGSKFVYEELDIAEYNRVVQLLSVIVLREVALEAQRKGKRHSLESTALAPSWPYDVLWPNDTLFKAEVKPFLNSVSEIHGSAAGYVDVLRFPFDAFIVRELARLLHQSSYRWMTWATRRYADLQYLVYEPTWVRRLRAIQPFFQAAARRGDSYGTTAAMQKAGAKWLSKILKSYESLALAEGFTVELEALSRWAGYMADTTDNPVYVSLYFAE